ncbi:outer membrane beta-barrel protein [Rhodopseudomonas sp. RCAM05734]|uniref:outer membrane beta-barrel protein n=1 Tax=Rhodopseudomonas sp. RCAM05734 TaxID=3457549 RepID=UPI0040441E5F
MKHVLLGGVVFVALLKASVGGQVANAADMPVKAVPYVAPWSWTGFYIGAHVGGAVGTTNFSDSFGPSIFGKVRSPGFFGGVQAGYNWEAPGSPWVFGVEADISMLDSDGTITCFASAGDAFNSTCRVRKDATGTLTGRIGYAAGPQGHTLVYAKGGFAWAHDKIDMATNNYLAPGTGFGPSGPAIASNSSRYNTFGGTVGAGVEQALSPAWSLKLEYDYLGFGSFNVANIGSTTINGAGAITAVVPPGTSGVAQGIHEFKVGLNYKWGADPGASWAFGSLGYPMKAAYKAPPLVNSAGGWAVEVGGRYVAGWSQFQYGLGQPEANPLSSISRLTYDDLITSSGEVFARVDMPMNWFVKGFVGGGTIKNGHINDEDFGIDPTMAYTNTNSPEVNGRSRYAVVDAGYDFLRGPAYKVGAFAGYFYYQQKLNAYGCTQIASPANPAAPCAPGNPGFQSVPPTGSAILTEYDKWQALRLGIAGEMMLTDRIKLSGEAAYLPYVKFNGEDNHFFGNSGVLASVDPQWGHGRGVQFESILSYMVTDQFSIGVGGRYWGMWTTDAQKTRVIAEGAPIVAPPPIPFRAAVEQSGVFVQASYKFNGS